LTLTDRMVIDLPTPEGGKAELTSVVSSDFLFTKTVHLSTDRSQPIDSNLTRNPNRYSTMQTT